MLDHATYAIVGGGVAAAAAVDGIRATDPKGDIVLFTTEWAPPYQRPPLSKEFLRGEAPLESVLMHPALWYLQNGVDVRVGVTVTAIAPAQHALHVDGEAVRYDKLLLATGATPRQLKIPGSDLDGVPGADFPARLALLAFREILVAPGLRAVESRPEMGMTKPAALRGFVQCLERDRTGQRSQWQ
jgi:NADPH-dependent 2,4-dienoyl-CoA reductase/sulfur reductase-like enzyme